MPLHILFDYFWHISKLLDIQTHLKGVPQHLSSFTIAKHLSQRMQTKKWITADQNLLLTLQVSVAAF